MISDFLRTTSKEYFNTFSAAKLSKDSTIFVNLRMETMTKPLRLSASQPLYLCLSLSPTSLEASREIKLRNIIALEQCHYPKQNHVCSYALFLDYLIDTDKDVDLLLEKGILKSWIWQPAKKLRRW
ncbi:uncharacterized protein LOC106411875 isoform X2 [Brassica napus]|uniref:uncharacterized protein LOC106411875 isoform X2 n=1 Tax=Brassica napus TaxID=3708 RepID=UPI0006AB5F31|nr:uncharacterized protein LOC106411875 isoform X2 [Brassica napus]